MLSTAGFVDVMETGKRETHLLAPQYFFFLASHSLMREENALCCQGAAVWQVCALDSPWRERSKG